MQTTVHVHPIAADVRVETIVGDRRLDRWLDIGSVHVSVRTAEVAQALVDATAEIAAMFAADRIEVAAEGVAS